MNFKSLTKVEVLQDYAMFKKGDEVTPKFRDDGVAYIQKDNLKILERALIKASRQSKIKLTFRG